MSGDETLHTNPGHKRLPYGLQAWQATVGYLQQTYGQAALSLSAHPGDVWGASVTWANQTEVVEACASLPEALKTLWAHVEAQHQLFQTLEDARRRPAHYGPDEWLEPETTATLHRLLHAATAAFDHDWHMSLVYRPVEYPPTRVQANLFAQANRLHVTGHGPSVREACQVLYRNAATHFVMS
jgi:hypothetical protein